MRANKIITEAQNALNRGVTRDTPSGERSMAHAVKIFEAVTGIELTETQGWTFMLALKQARMMRGKPHPDNYIDLAGYAALLGEAALESRVTDEPRAICGRCGSESHHVSDCPRA